MNILKHPITFDANQGNQRFAFDEPADWSAGKCITLALQSRIESFHAFEILLMSPDENNAYVIPEIRLDWSGETDFQLDRERFVARGTPKGWGEITGIAFSAIRDGYEPNELQVTAIEALPTNMEIHVTDDEVVIDYQYMDYLSQQPQWRTQGPVSGRQAGYAGGAWTLLDSDKGSESENEPASIHREMNISVDGYQAIEFYGTTSPQLRWRPCFEIDGKRVTGQWHTGEGQLTSVLFPIPVASRQLTSISLELERVDREKAHLPAVLLMYTVAKVKRTVPWTDSARWIPDDLLAVPSSADSRTSLPERTFLMDEVELRRFRREAKDGFGSRQLAVWKQGADWIVRREFTSAAGSILPSRYCGKDKHPGCLDGLYSEWSWNSSTNTDSGWTWSIRMLTHAYLADGSEVYGRALVQLLVSVCTIEHWNSVRVGTFPLGAKQNLPFAREISAEVGPAYDAVKHLMSAAQREYVTRMLLAKGLYPTHDYLRRHPEIWAMNQGLVYANAIGLGVLPLVQDHPGLQWLLRDAEDRLYETLARYLFSDGGCAEGPAYWKYTMEVCSGFLGALARADPDRFRSRMPEGLPHAMRYPVFTRSNSYLDEEGKLAPVGININDRGSPLFEIKLLACILAKYADSAQARSWLAGMEPELDMLWCWPENDDAEVESEAEAESEAAAGDARGALIDAERVAASGAAAGADGDTASGSEPLGFRFPVLDMIVARSGYQFGDFLLVQQNGPNRLGGHTQYDRGALLIECYGEHPGLDSGTISYEDPGSDRLKDTDLHPHTITINGQKRQKAFEGDGGAVAQVTRYIHSPMADYNRADLTKAYPELASYERDVFYFRPNLVVCIDRLEADQPFDAAYHINSEGTVSLNEHGNGSGSWSGNGTRIISAASFSKLVSTFLAKTEATGEAAVFPTNNRAINHHMSLRVGDAGDRSLVIVGVHEANLTGEEEAAVEAGSSSAAETITITKGSRKIVFVLGSSNGTAIDLPNIQTDGRYAYVITEHEEIAGFGLVDGTYVNVRQAGGEAEFELRGSDSFSAFADVRDDGRLVLVPAVAAGDRRLQLQLKAPGASIRSREIVWWNPADPADGGRAGVSFDLPESAPNPYWYVVGGDAADTKRCAEPRVSRLLIDGRSYPTGTRVPYGSTPVRFEVELQSPDIPFEAETLAVLLDGKDIRAHAATSWNSDRSSVRVTIDPQTLERHMDPSSYTHSLSVRASNRGLERRQAHAFVQFYTPIRAIPSASLLNRTPELLAGRAVKLSLKPNKQLMTSCYSSGGYPIKVNGTEYGEAIHCELGGSGRTKSFEAVYDLADAPDGTVFTGAWAVDDSAGVDELPGIAEIYLETERGEWRLAYASPPLRRYGSLAAFEVPLEGARSMKLQCKQGNSIVLIAPELDDHRRKSNADPL